LEWFLHGRRESVQIGFWGVQELDAADKIGMPECGNDVIGTLRSQRFAMAVIYDEGQRWPDVKGLPHRCLVCAPKSEIQAMC
jgi:hypothetical protein